MAKKDMTKPSWQKYLTKAGGVSETEVEDMTIADISAIVRGSQPVIYEVSNHMLYRQDADDIRWIADRLKAVGNRLAILSKVYEGIERQQRTASTGRLDHIKKKDK